MLIKHADEWLPLFWFPVNDYHNYIYLFLIFQFQKPLLRTINTRKL
jgi:hypothetical protein